MLVKYRSAPQYDLSMNQYDLPLTDLRQAHSVSIDDAHAVAEKRTQIVCGIMQNLKDSLLQYSLVFSGQAHELRGLQSAVSSFPLHCR